MLFEVDLFVVGCHCLPLSVIARRVFAQSATTEAISCFGKRTKYEEIASPPKNKGGGSQRHDYLTSILPVTASEMSAVRYS